MASWWLWWSVSDQWFSFVKSLVLLSWIWLVYLFSDHVILQIQYVLRQLLVSEDTYGFGLERASTTAVWLQGLLVHKFFCVGSWFIHYYSQGYFGFVHVVMFLISLIMIQSCWVLQVSEIWWRVDAVSIFVAVIVVDFRLLWNPRHSYDWHWTNWTRKSPCCLLRRCRELLVLGLCCADGWFIHQIYDLCLIRINHWSHFMCGLNCL